MTAPRALSRRSRTARSLPDGAAATVTSRRRVRRGVSLSAAVLFAIGCLVPLADPAAALRASEVVDSPIGFENARCAVTVPDSRAGDVSCGYLTVPERRTEGSDPARTLRLPVAVIRSTSTERASDSLVVPVSATPGGSFIGALAYFLAGPRWVGPRDVVLVEQRGGVRAEPSLDCPELDGAVSRTERLGALQACRDRLIGEGIDLGAYSSAETAADLAELRVALDYPTWNLYGTGDGSRLAMTVLRDRPDGLRSVILDGAFPPDADRYELLPAGVQGALDALFARCYASSECRTHHPDPAKQLEAALARADRSPFTVTARAPASRAPATVTIGGAGIVEALSTALSDPQSARIIPYVIDRLAAGEGDAILPLVQRRLDAEPLASEGLELSIECAEELPFHDPVAVETAASASALARHVDRYAQRSAECEVWAVPPADPREALPVTSSVPTLLLSGAFDPWAPSTASALAAVGLARHFAYDFPDTGRAPVWAGGCPASIARQFLDDPVSAPKAGCIDRMPATVFLSAADIDPTPAVYRIDDDLRHGASPGQIGIVVSTLALFVGTLVYGVVYAVRRRWDAPAGAVFAAVSAASLNLAFVGVIALVLANVDPVILEYGMPSAAWPLLLLPFAALACAAVLVVLLVRSWMHDDGALAHRVILTISALGTLGFAVWLLTRGLLAL